MSNIFYPILIAPLSEEDGGGFMAYVPDLHGCMSDGETPEEALSSVQGAITEWCDEARRLGREIPAPFSARDQMLRDREKVAGLLKRQDALLQGHRADYDALTTEIEKIKAAVEEMQERAAERAPWDIVPAYAKVAERSRLPN